MKKIKLLFLFALLLTAATQSAWAKTIDLSTVTSATTAADGDVLTGTLGKNVKISIAAGATVTLQDATIIGSSSSSYKWAGISCVGNATIILCGTNTVKGFYSYYPAIYVPQNYTLTIQGDGSLEAIGQEGAAIGGAYRYDIKPAAESVCGNITIKSGTITAYSSLNVSYATGAAIGCGGGLVSGSSCGNITIEGGTITATGCTEGPGIGGGRFGTCGNITITGGTITATSGNYSAAIGGGYQTTCGNITITSGVTKVTAIKTGSYSPNSIGSGYWGSCGTVTIGGVETGNISKSPYIYPIPDKTLADSEDNAAWLTENNGETYNVTLTRTLPADGFYNTFAVPFNTAIPEGWTVKELNGATLDGNVLTLNFADAASIEAGKPYLVMVSTDVENPTFEEVTISNAVNATVADGISFIPTLGAADLEGEADDIFFLGAENTLYNPSNARIKGFRAYFKLTESAPAAVSAYVLDLGNGETTGIGSLNNESALKGQEGIYSLDGRRIEGLPTEKGIYIVNGKKKVIK